MRYVTIIIYIDINLQTLYVQLSEIKILIVKYNTLFSDIQIDVHLNHIIVNFISIIIIFIFSISRYDYKIKLCNYAILKIFKNS